MRPFLGVLACGLIVFTATGATYVVGSNDASEVRFDSKATLESFTGRTRHVSGNVSLDPGTLGDSLTVTVTVDLTTIDTGISKRNDDMRENHLETDRFPTATFFGGGIISKTHDAIPADGAVTLEVTGTMALHGVERRITIPVDIARVESDVAAIRITSRFPIRLDDYAITRPRFLFLKLAETQQVSVTLIATRTP